MPLRSILLLALLSLYSFQSLGLFSEQFLKEINKIKPIALYKDKVLSKMISKYFKLYKMEKSHTVKTVDLANIYETCNLDFEVNLVKGFLPASDHQINHINIGGVLTPGQTPHYVNKWVCTVGVAIENLGEPNSVYSLLYNLSTTFSKSSLLKDSGIDLSDIDETELVNYFFYTELLKIYNEEILPIKKIDIEKEEK